MRHYIQSFSQSSLVLAARHTKSYTAHTAAPKVIICRSGGACTTDDDLFQIFYLYDRNFSKLFKMKPLFH